MMGQESLPAVNVGQDDGRFGVKTVFADASGHLVKAYVPSTLALGSRVADMGADSARFRWFEEGSPDVTYVRTDQVEGVDTRTPSYDTSPVAAILTHAALVEAGLGGRDVRLVTGLPVCKYFRAGVRNVTLIDAKTHSLKSRLVRCMDASVALARIAEHSAVAEGVAAFYDAMVNVDGTVNEDVARRAAAGVVAVVDVGGETTDIATIFEAGQSMDARRSGTAQIGTLNLNERLESRLCSTLGLTSISRRQVDDAAMSGVFRLRGQDTDVHELVVEEKRRLAAEIKAEIARRIGEGADIEMVLLCGGGVLLLRDELMGVFSDEQVRVADDPQFANAMGMWKIAQYVKAA